jgi:hypothetical protein
MTDRVRCKDCIHLRRSGHYEDNISKVYVEKMICSELGEKRENITEEIGCSWWSERIT